MNLERENQDVIGPFDVPEAKVLENFNGHPAAAPNSSGAEPWPDKVDAAALLDGLQRVMPGVPVTPQVLKVDDKGMPIPAPPPGSPGAGGSAPAGDAKGGAAKPADGKEAPANKAADTKPAGKA